ncbi:MAG: tRNA (adenosine(37)-N6)-dimethylallyltransferase MiaA [Myxococcales bacterium]|nr:tRNA (adenosine(37)-N6)-dimethylallyltransferase MiaA [Myxococcales bacterium]
MASPLLVIVGPTGAGKTELALRVAESVGAEIVSADSQQVYRGMDIGTGKATAEEQGRVPHHLLDVLDPNEEMTAGRFVELADAAIADGRERGKPVIVAGGTMLYVRALLRGLFEGPAADLPFREELAARAEAYGLDALWQELASVDAPSSETINKTDKRRVIRALEVYRRTGKPLSEHHRLHKAQPDRYDYKMVGVQPEREQLYCQIDARVLRMMDAGLLAEVEGLRGKGYGPDLRSQQAIGYCELHDHLGGITSKDAAIALIQRNSRRYARRQLSWYRGQEDLLWYASPSEVDPGVLARCLV